MGMSKFERLLISALFFIGVILLYNAQRAPDAPPPAPSVAATAAPVAKPVVLRRSGDTKDRTVLVARRFLDPASVSRVTMEHVG